MGLNLERDLPAEWTVHSAGDLSSIYQNGDKGLEVEIRAVYRGTKARSRRGDPTHFVVEMHQDWFSEGIHGDRDLSAKLETLDSAKDTALEFMHEFSDELRETSPADVQAAHRTSPNHEIAEQYLTRVAGVEALADVAGYSDELLLDVIRDDTNRQIIAVVHRDGSEANVVEGDSYDLMDVESVNSLFGALSRNNGHLLELVAEDSPAIMTVHHGEYTCLRFVYGPQQETNVVLPRGAQYTSPYFENKIANVLEEKLTG